MMRPVFLRPGLFALLAVLFAATASATQRPIPSKFENYDDTPVMIRKAEAFLIETFATPSQIGSTSFRQQGSRVRYANRAGLAASKFDLSGDGREISISDFFIFAQSFAESAGKLAVGECEGKSGNERDYCYDLEAVKTSNEDLCNLISERGLVDLCKYRVGVFSGTSKRDLRGYKVEFRSDRDLEYFLAQRELREFSLDEYDTLGKRDSRTVANLGNALLFVVRAPEDVKYARMESAGVDFGYLYDDLVNERLLDFEEDVYVLTKRGFVLLKDHNKGRSDFLKNVVPVIDNEVVFVFSSGRKTPVIDIAFSDITFAEDEDDFYRLSRLYPEKLLPNGEFVDVYE